MDVSNLTTTIQLTPESVFGWVILCSNFIGCSINPSHQQLIKLQIDSKEPITFRNHVIFKINKSNSYKIYNLTNQSASMH